MTDPTLWHNVVAQPRAVAQLDAAVREPVHAYLFLGPPGSTKNEAARAFAAGLLCALGGCGQCRDCRLALAGEHPDQREVARIGAAISAEQAEEIIRLASLSPVEGSRKVLVLEEFHLLRPEGAARLLKTIEEPTPSTVFIVLADDLPPELVTIASRCVRVEFAAIAEDTIVEVLLGEEIAPEQALAAARAAGGDLGRARDLAHDPEVARRRSAFASVPHRLDGTGAVAASIVDELLALIDEAAVPIRERHVREVGEFNERVERFGLRGSGGRRELEERHKRELRRHRTDELKAGLVAMAATYRDQLVMAGGPPHESSAKIGAVGSVHDALESFERNPNETLLLQALLLQLPSA